jgi:ATP-dependent DNA helicase RecQ
MKSAIEILNTVFGHKSFRSMQENAVEAAIAGHDVIALMGTSAGKTICYAVPILAREGVGIVISPLKALMFDQVTKLQSLGLAAETINSDVTGYDRQNILDAVRRGEVKFLYVTPELVAQPWFQKFIKEVDVAAVGIDEAHCASQYGHDTRPDYKKLGVLKFLLPNVPHIAVTATADALTLEDMKSILNMGDAVVVKGDLDRKNIVMNMAPRQPQKKHRDILKQLLSRHDGESGLIYCLGQATVEKMTDWLIEEGYSALPYHGGLEIMDREINQERFTNNEVDILVCTVAFGMGIDKENIRYVIHDTVPGNPESYIQEIGRAGRDGGQAYAYMFYSNQTVVQRRKMVGKSNSSAPRRRTEYAKLDAIIGICETTTCRRKAVMKYFGQVMENDCGECDNCISAFEAADLSDAARDIMHVIQASARRTNAFDVVEAVSMSNVQSSSILRQLIASGHVNVDHTQYCALAVTASGRDIIDGHRRFTGNDAYFLESAAILPVVKKSAPKTQEKRSAPVKTERAPSTARRASKPRREKGSPLLQALRAERNSIARERRVKKFMIVHDGALQQMSTDLPRSLTELLAIKGIGQDKADRYGVTFLNIIREHA